MTEVRDKRFQVSGFRKKAQSSKLKAQGSKLIAHGRCKAAGMLGSWEAGRLNSL
jgi:hypothetical protein